MQRTKFNSTSLIRNLAISFLIVVFFLGFSSKSFAAVGIYEVVNFQGKVVNKTAGTNVTNGNYDFTFKIFSVASAGTVIWTENFNTANSNQLTVTDGIFRVALGSVCVLTGGSCQGNTNSAVDFNSDSLYLDITFNAETFGTRVRLTAVPYAFNAKQVNGLTVTNNGGNTLNIAANKTLTASNTLTLAGTDSTTITFQGTDTYVGRTTTDTLTNKTIGSTGLIFSGAATDVTTVSNEDLTLAVNGSGNFVISSDFDSAITLGTAISNEFPLLVRNGIGNNAALAIDNLNLGDLFTASSAGITKFRVANNGDLILSAAINLGGTNATSSDCLKGGATAVWGSCAAGAGSNWDVINGVITPKLTSTLDFLLGSQATDSAKFAIANINSSASPIASLSATTASGGSGNGIVLDSTGSIQSLRNNTLTLGGATTGNINISPLNGGAGSLLTVNALITTFNTTTTMNVTSLTTFNAGLLATVDSAASLGIDATTLTLGNGSAATLATTTNGLTLNSGSNALTIDSTDTTLTASGIATVDLAATVGIDSTTVNLGGGSAAVLGTISDDDLTLTPNGSGNLILTGDFNTQVLIGVTGATTEFPLLIRSGIGNNAALAIDNLNSGDILTASASGTTRFSITSAGGIKLGTSEGSSNNCLLSGGAGLAATWNTCPGGSSLFTDATGFTYLTDIAEDFVLGGSTIAAATFYMDVSAGTLYLGTNNTGAGGINGLLTFYSSGNGIADPTISVDASGNLTLSATEASASVIIGDGSGNISLSLTAAADSLIADKTVALAAAYSGNDFTFNRILTSDNASENMSGAVLYVADTSTGLSGNTATGDLILGNAALTTTPFTGNLLRLQKSGSDRVIITHSGQIGSGVTPVSQLQITRPLSYGVTGKALAVFDQIENQDIFTASAGATPIFTITRSGGIALGTNGLTFGTASDCLKGGATAAWGSCGAGGGGSSNWTVINGALKPNNDTLDILFGGTSTSSAKFAFMNLDPNSGLDPLASFSGNLMLESRPNSSVSQQTTWTKISQTTAGTIMSAGTANISSISAMTVYNGSLYVGTFKGAAGAAGEAEVYRYKGTSSNWERVSSVTPGTIGGTGTPTSGIASVSAMTVFDGRLYIGTSKMNQAEIYRYEGGTTWIKVSHGTPGTIGGTGTPTANIDGISSMAVYQGMLYAGTREHTTTAGTAQLYRWDKAAGATAWTVVNTTAGTFVATNTIGVWAVSSMVVKNGYLYLGVLKPGDADVLMYQGGVGSVFLSMNLASLTGSYLINGTAVTQFSDVPSMAVYNGSLVVGLSKLNGAEVLMLSDGGGTQTVPNSWIRINDVAGTMTSGGTANIDSISSMAVYNGSLYVGTLEANSAEIYRYTLGGGDRLMKLTGASGAIKTGDTSAIDGVVKMIQANGDLVIGTMELGRAEIYKNTTNPIDSSYALKFHAKPSIAGGEQNSISNYASIFFMASASASLGSNAGNGGAFVFSHGIQTKNGSYDIAEDYPTRDDSLEPGDLVAIDTKERGFVKRSIVALDAGVIGVYSEKPALRLTQEDVAIDGGRAIPVALAGRVPVKVSTENGKIKPGDYLTASSIAGVAMKATKTGNVVGQAMGGYDQEGIGRIVVYVRSNSYSGTAANLFEGIDSTAANFEQEILTKLNSQTHDGLVSEINTDRIVAGLEIITPRIVTDELIVKKIKAEQIEGLEIITGKLSIIDSNIASLSAIFKTNNSTKDFENINEASKEVVNSTQELVLAGLNVNGIATISADLRVKGSGLVEGIFSIVDTLVTNNLIVNGVSNFFADVIFKGNVLFESRPTFNSDTGGFAVVKKDAERVEVSFEKEYEKMPVVSTDMAFDQKKNDDGSVKDSKEIEQKVFEKDYSFVIVNKSTKGFTIVLNKKAEDDIEFSWIALSVKETKISFSKEIINLVQEKIIKNNIAPEATLQNGP